MTQTAVNDELEAAIADAELTDEEAAQARELHGQGGDLAAIIPFIVSEREPIEPDDDAPVEQPKAGASEPSKKQLDALEKELVRHEKRVHEVMGEFASGMVTCATCGGIGLAEPGEPEPELQPHEWFIECEKCAGIGLVLTGSKRPGNSTVDCPGCRGRGYLEAIRDGQPLASGPSLAAPAPAELATGETPAIAAPAESPLTFGVPPWMGDPNLST